MKIKIWISAVIFAMTITGRAYADASDWLKCEALLALPKILFHISPPGAKPGALIASPTEKYVFHWIRDAGLVVTALVEKYEATSDATEKHLIGKKISEYMEFSRAIQNIKGDPRFIDPRFVLGEAKVNVDGSAYNDFWGRPQNDGPALRAISLIAWARVLKKEGRENEVREKLYSNSNMSLIKRDLEYISHHWRDKNYDLWEEVKGDHFYTRMVHRRAMIEGAAFAKSMGDEWAAQWYSKQAQEIQASIENFWDEKRQIFVATLNREDGIDYKDSNIDSAVVLGLLHGGLNDGFLTFRDPRVKSTILKINEAFKLSYNINQNGPGVATGRYPEDRYEGGNPWVLTTLAFAEAYYKMAREHFIAGERAVTLEAVLKAEDYIERVKLHAHTTGNLNEQINRYTGNMHGVEDLTWNYAAILTANRAREQALK